MERYKAIYRHCALARISTAEQNIDKEQTSLNKLSDTYYNVDKIPYTLLNLKNRMNQLETDCPTMRNDINSNASNISEHENRITNLEVASGSGETSQGFLNLVSRVDQAEENISSVSNRLDDTNEYLNTVSAELMNHIIHLVKIKVSVASWSSDNKYTDFPYKATITNSLIESEHVANVVFDVEQATSGIFAPINYTDNGKMYIYANAIPDSEITIPAIYLTRRCAY